MKYCQYHPLKPATYACYHCHKNQCDHCSDEGEHGDENHCFICGRELASLGARYNAEPFWRRFQEGFRYPLQLETIIFIVAIAFFSIIITFLPFTIVWLLVITGIFMKYCFSCLESTAKGSMTAPDITTAYEGGIVLALKLFAIFFILGLSVFGLGMWLGISAATILGVAIMICLPAIIINFSLSESVVDAINPVKIIYLVTAIGLPYGLLLAIIMVMAGSVGFISAIIGVDSMFSLSLQSVVSNYYTIVLFHLMGYMLFQYQDRLGFIARHEEDEINNIRGDTDRLLAKIEVHVKEGYYDRALKLFQTAIKAYPTSKPIHTQCMDFLLATKNYRLIEDFSTVYFNFLVKNHSRDQLTLAYKKILHVHPKYCPESPEDKLLLAQECKASGDSLSAVRLLNGIHKDSPNFPRLVQALELTHDALQDIPSMKDKVEKFGQLLKHYQQQEKKKTKAPPKPSPSKNMTLEDKIKQNAEQNSPLSLVEKDEDQNKDKGIDFS